MPPLNLLQLPDRLSPAVLTLPGAVTCVVQDMGGSEVRTPAGEFAAFEESYLGGLNAVGLGSNLLLGANIGGGPRVMLLDPLSNSILADVFVGDPESRQGVITEAMAEILAAASGESVTAPDPSTVVQVWRPEFPQSYGWGPVRVNLEPAGWVGSGQDATELLTRVFDEIAARGGDPFAYTVGWLLESPAVVIPLGAGMDVGDVVEEILA